MGLQDSDVDPFDAISTGSGIELELDAAAPPPRAAPVAGSAPRAATGRREPEEETVSPRAVELAGYGKPPSLFVEIPYAIEVLRRNRELKAKLPELRRLRDVAAKEMDTANVELGRAVLEGREHPRARELGTPLRIAFARWRLVHDAVRELEEARARTKEAREAHEAAIEEAERDAVPLREEARALQAEIVTHQGEFEAVSKVIQELTAQLDALGADGDPNRRIELEATRTNRKLEADGALTEIDARTPRLSELDAEVARLGKAAEKARAAVEADAAGLAKLESKVGKETADSRAELEEALRDLADEAIRKKLHRELAPIAAKTMRVRYDAWKGRDRELRAHETALTLYHRNAVRRGLAEMALLAIGVVALFVDLAI